MTRVQPHCPLTTEAVEVLTLAAEGGGDTLVGEQPALAAELMKLGLLLQVHGSIFRASVRGCRLLREWTFNAEKVMQ